jgi:hypothetical protein
MDDQQDRHLAVAVDLDVETVTSPPGPEGKPGDSATPPGPNPLALLCHGPVGPPSGRMRRPTPESKFRPVIARPTSRAGEATYDPSSGPQ